MTVEEVMSLSCKKGCLVERERSLSRKARPLFFMDKRERALRGLFMGAYFSYLSP